MIDPIVQPKVSVPTVCNDHDDSYCDMESTAYENYTADDNITEVEMTGEETETTESEGENGGSQRFVLFNKFLLDDELISNRV